MTHVGSHLIRAIGATFVIILTSTNAVAQTVQPMETRVPGVTISFASGQTVPYCCPETPIRALIGSVQVPVGPRWFAEGEWRLPTKSSFNTGLFVVDDRTDRPYVRTAIRDVTTDVNGLSASLTYRFGAGRKVSWYAGAGLTYMRTHETDVWDSRCVPRVPGGCDGVPLPSPTFVDIQNSLLSHVVAGIEVTPVPFLTAFAAVKLNDGVTTYGGVRVAVTTRPRGVTSQTVRVREQGGRVQQGVLVSLTASEVVIERRGERVTLPLSGVRRVEKVTHRVRNITIASAILGYVGGYFASCGGGDEEDCWPEIGLMVAGMSAGTGAIVGWAINRGAARSGRDVLYTAPSRTPIAMTVAPVLSPTRAGVGMTVRW